ncbi:DUF397 domain-containing protein [Thermopolyspora sp. NPDC052614]|uniref:DUF397 domain-containing protein n=1 Tax=Thermopolyspora sp. NPDC052614 TaxID=3155682 RepID=UPI003448A2EE
MTKPPASSRLKWRSASASGGQNCLQVAAAHDRVVMRDGKAGPSGPILSFTKAEWTAFIRDIKGGRFL